MKVLVFATPLFFIFSSTPSHSAVVDTNLSTANLVKETLSKEVMVGGEGINCKIQDVPVADTQKQNLLPPSTITPECRANIDELGLENYAVFKKELTPNLNTLEKHDMCFDKTSLTYFPDPGSSVEEFIRSGYYGRERKLECPSPQPSKETIEQNYKDAMDVAGATIKRRLYPKLNWDNYNKEFTSSKESLKAHVAKHISAYCLRENISPPVTIPGCESKALVIPSVTFQSTAKEGYDASLLRGSGAELMEKIRAITSDKSTSCDEKNDLLANALAGKTVNTLDDYILLRLLAQNPNEILTNPSMSSLLQAVMNIKKDLTRSTMGGPPLHTNFCMDGHTTCRSNDLDYITLRNFLGGKYLEVLSEEPFNLSNTYKFANLDNTQQATAADKIIAELGAALKNPQKMFTEAEAFRNSCDKKATAHFMPDGGFCTVSGCGPDRTDRSGKASTAGLNVTGNLACPSYDTGKDGRFHCYVDKNLTSTKEAEKTQVRFPSTKNLGSFRGTGLYLAKAHHRSCGKGFCLGGEGGGGFQDDPTGKESGYLHVHMDFRVPYGKRKARVDPVDIFCREPF